MRIIAWSSYVCSSDLGYKLVYTSQPNSTVSSAEDSSGSVNLTYGAGLGLSKSGEVTEVVWDSPAFNAGLTVGMNVIAVNGTSFSYERITQESGRASCRERVCQNV